MQNIFTLEELKEIQKQYLECTVIVLLCTNRLFENRWDSFNEEIQEWANKFLDEFPIYKEKYETGSLYLFQSIDTPHTVKEKRQIRIDFLDWLIENTES